MSGRRKTGWRTMIPAATAALSDVSEAVQRGALPRSKLMPFLLFSKMCSAEQPRGISDSPVAKAWVWPVQQPGGCAGWSAWPGPWVGQLHSISPEWTRKCPLGPRYPPPSSRVNTFGFSLITLLSCSSQPLPYISQFLGAYP